MIFRKICKCLVILLGKDKITAVFTKSYIDKVGKTMHRGVLCLGGLPDIGKDGRNRLASMLSTMNGEG